MKKILFFLFIFGMKFSYGSEVTDGLNKSSLQSLLNENDKKIRRFHEELEKSILTKIQSKYVTDKEFRDFASSIEQRIDFNATKLHQAIQYTENECADLVEQLQVKNKSLEEKLNFLEHKLSLLEDEFKSISRSGLARQVFLLEKRIQGLENSHKTDSFSKKEADDLSLSSKDSSDTKNDDTAPPTPHAGKGLVRSEGLFGSACLDDDQEDGFNLYSGSINLKTLDPVRKK